MSPGGVLDQDYQQFSSNPNNLIVPDSPSKQKEPDAQESPAKNTKNPLNESQSFRIMPLEASQGSFANFDEKPDSQISPAKDSEMFDEKKQTKNDQKNESDIGVSLNSDTANFGSPQTLEHKPELNFTKKKSKEEIEIPPTPSPVKFVEDEVKKAPEKSKKIDPNPQTNMLLNPQPNPISEMVTVTPKKDDQKNPEFPVVGPQTETPESQLNQRYENASPVSLNIAGETPGHGLQPTLAESTEIPQTSPAGISGTDFNLSPFSNLDSAQPKFEDHNPSKSNTEQVPVQTTKFEPEINEKTDEKMDQNVKSNPGSQIVPEVPNVEIQGSKTKSIPEMLKNSNPSMLIPPEEEMPDTKPALLESSSKVMAPPSPEKNDADQGLVQISTPSKPQFTQKPTDKWKTPPMSKNTPITEVVELDDLPPVEDSTEAPFVPQKTPADKNQKSIDQPTTQETKKATDKWKPVLNQKNIPVTEVLELDDLPPIDEP